MYIVLCFLERHSCFDMKKERTDFAVADSDAHATSYYRKLLDITYFIPKLMEEYDSAALASVGRLTRC